MDKVRCGCCGFIVFDGLVIKTTLLRHIPDGSGFQAKCKRCKKWVFLPLVYKNKESA